MIITDNLTSMANRIIEDNALNIISNRQIDIHITQVTGGEALDFEEHLTSIKEIPYITDAYKAIHDISGFIDTQAPEKFQCT